MWNFWYNFRSKKINNNYLDLLASHARQRGKDSSGLIFTKDKNYVVKRADYDIKKAIEKSWQAKC